MAECSIQKDKADEKLLSKLQLSNENVEIRKI